jgi:serine/threonine-protein kinase RsbW
MSDNPMPCAVVSRTRENEPLVTLRGDVDFNNAAVMRDAIVFASKRPGPTIVVDLSDVSFIDSSGLSTLVGAARALHEQGRWIRLERGSEHLIRLLQTAGFSRYFQVPSQLTPGGLPPVPGRGNGKIWNHASFRVPARAKLVSDIRSRVTDLLVASVPLTEDCLDNIRLAVGEAASNAVRHGCRNNDELKVSVECCTDGETLVVEISDPGPGFDLDSVPTPSGTVPQEGGMGIHFMRLMMDEVLYTFEKGTHVRLVKRLTILDADSSGERRGAPLALDLQEEPGDEPPPVAGVPWFGTATLILSDDEPVVLAAASFRGDDPLPQRR